MSRPPADSYLACLEALRDFARSPGRLSQRRWERERRRPSLRTLHHYLGPWPEALYRATNLRPGDHDPPELW